MENANRNRIANNHNRSYLAQFCICACLVAVFFWILSQLYTFIMVSADDVLYEKILSGVMTGKPDAHSYFLRYSFSAFIVLLYEVFPGIHWYQAILVFSLGLCVFSLFERVVSIKISLKPIYLLVMILLLFSVCSEEIVHFEWTVTAGLLGATALYRLCTIPSNNSRARNVVELCVCLLLLILCFDIRKTVFLLFSPLFCVCVVYRYVKYDKISLHNKFGVFSIKSLLSKKRIITVLFLITLIVIISFTTIQHRCMYAADDWRQYDEYTRDRAVLFDYSGYPDFDVYYDVYEDSGISRESYLLMSSDYNFIVPCNSFKDMRIDKIAALSHELYDSSFQAKLDFMYNRFLQVYSSEKLLFVNFYVVVLGTTSVVLAQRKGPIDILFILASIVLWGGLSGYLAFKGRIPDHVVTCLDYSLFFVLLAYIVNYWNERTSVRYINDHVEVLSKASFKKSRFCNMVVSIAVVIILVFTSIINCFQLKETNEKKELMAQAHFQIVQYCEEHPQNLYLRDFWSFSQRGELFWYYDYDADNYIVTGGWTYNSPLFNEVLIRWDCEDFLNSVTSEDGNYYYLVSESRCGEVKERLDSYFRSQGANIEMVEADTFETSLESVVVLKFQYYN